MQGMQNTVNTQKIDTRKIQNYAKLAGYGNSEKYAKYAENNQDL